MSKRNEARLRRARKSRGRIRSGERARLSVYRSGQHIYAQVLAARGGTTLAAASTVEKDIRGGLKGTSNVDAASAVGRAIAEKARAAGVSEVAFDRSGYKYHGRVKALAEAAREAGLNF